MAAFRLSNMNMCPMIQNAEFARESRGKWVSFVLDMSLMFEVIPQSLV